MIFNSLILIFVLPFSLAVHDNENEILNVNTTIACDESEEPLIVNEKYGIITPTSDLGYVYPPNASCSWTLIAPENQIIFFRFLSIDLDFKLRDSISIYDGFNESSRLLTTVNGRPFHIRDIESKGHNLHIRFKGMSLPQTSGFSAYFEHRLKHVSCGPKEISCRNGLKCVNAHGSACNGIDDCGDGTDEERCNLTNDSFHFPNGCGISRIPPILDNNRIFGGRKAIPGSWPWMVDLRFPSEEPFHGHKCGATLINSQWLITAAHCFIWSTNPKYWQIHLGKYRKLIHDPTEVIRYIENYYIHPEFNGLKELPDNATFLERFGNDIALIKMNAPVPTNHTFISPVCLPQLNAELNANEFVFTTGWGITMDTGNPLVLKQAKLPVVTNDKCSKWMSKFVISKDMICAGYENGGHDACNGDSGGPLVHLNPQTKRWDIVGIVSIGDDCGAKEKAGAYTKVSHYINWIEKTIKDHYKTQNMMLKKTLINQINNNF